MKMAKAVQRLGPAVLKNLQGEQLTVNDLSESMFVFQELLFVLHLSL